MTFFSRNSGLINDKIDCHDMTAILFKVAINTHDPLLLLSFYLMVISNCSALSFRCLDENLVTVSVFDMWICFVLRPLLLDYLA